MRLLGETVRNWMSKNDPAFRPDFFRAFERSRAIAVGKAIKSINDAKDWRAAAYWLERNDPDFAPKGSKSAVVNQATVNEKPTIQTDAETVKALSEAYDKMMMEKEEATKCE